MGKTYDSEEVFVAVVFEVNNPESSTVVYAGHDEKLALGAIQSQVPGNHDRARIERWQDGKRRVTKTFNIFLRSEVVEV